VEAVSDPGAAAVAGLTTALNDLLERGGAGDAVERLVIMAAIGRAEVSDPELAWLLRACAIPRTVDATIVGVLRDDQADERRNRDLLGRIAGYSFVRASSVHGYAYHELARQTLLGVWREPERRDEFDELAGRLVAFFQSRYDAAVGLSRHLEAASGVIQQASPGRLAQLWAALDARLLSPLVDVIYHRAQSDVEAGYSMFRRYFHQYEEKSRLAVCRSLVETMREVVEALPPGPDRDARLAWMRYYDLRLRRRVDPAVGIEKLQALRAQARSDPVLEMWILADMGLALYGRDRLREARDLFAEELRLAETSRADLFNLPSSRSRLGMVLWALDDLDGAKEMYRAAAAAAAAPESRNPDLRVASLVNVALLDEARGDDDAARDAAFEALDLVWTSLPGERRYHQTVAECFLQLFASGDPLHWSTLLAENEALLNVTEVAQPSLELRARAAQILAACGMRNAAEWLLGQLRGRHDLDLAARLRLLDAEAMLAESRGLLDDSIERYSTVAAESAGTPGFGWQQMWAVMDQGDVLRRMGRWAEAGERFRTTERLARAVGNGPLAAVAMIRRASLFRLRGQLDRAQELVERASGCLGARVTYSARLERELGHIAGLRGRASDAAKHYRASAASWDAGRRPIDAARDLLALSGSLLRAGRPDEALVEARRAAGAIEWTAALARSVPTPEMVDANRLDAEGLRRLVGDAAVEQGLRDARDRFRRARERVPDNSWFALNLAYTAALLGEWGQAARGMRDVLKHRPEWARSAVLRRRALSFRIRRAAQQLGRAPAVAVRELAACLDDVEHGRGPGWTVALASELGDALLSAGELDLAARAYARPAAGGAGASPVPAADAARLGARRGLVAALRGDVAGAVDELGQAVTGARADRDPDARPAALVVLVASLCRSRDERLSLGQAVRVLARGPDLRPDEASELLVAWQAVVRRSAAERAAADSHASPRVRLVLGPGLAPATDDGAEMAWMVGAGLPELRAAIEEATGVRLPGVHVTNDYGLAPTAFEVRMDGVVVARLKADLGPNATLRGAHEYVLGCLRSALAPRLGDFLTVSGVNGLLDAWAAADPERVELRKRATPDLDAVLRLSALLRGLVDEGVPVRDLETIISVVAAPAAGALDELRLAERVRASLVAQLPGRGAGIRRLGVSPAFERVVRASVRPDAARPYLALVPDDAAALQAGLQAALASSGPGAVALVVRSHATRPHVRRLAARIRPEVPVLAADELAPEDRTTPGAVRPGAKEIHGG
jgi:tetratricopeptide (TPR) repeat protein